MYGGALTGLQSGVSGGQLQALSQFGAVGDLFGIVNRIAESVGLCDWDLNQQESNGDLTFIDDASAPARHPATALWSHPNPFQTRFDYLQTSEQHVDLAGESYWVISQGGPTGPTKPQAGMDAGIELWTIRPDRITPIPDPDKFIAGYLYKNGSQAVPLPVEAVVHIRVPNPNDPYGGLGPTQALMSDLDSAKYLSLWNRNFFMNSAEPGGIIQFDTPLSDVDFDRIVTRWREQHQGVANAHRVAILERGVWVDRKYTQRDMQFAMLREQARDNILFAFGMHSAIMGVAKDVNRANAEAAEVGFSRWVLRPRLERIKLALNERVLPLIGDNLRMDYVDPAPQDVTTATNTAVALYIARIMTLNEARDQAGLPARDGPGADDFLPQTAQPLPLQAPPHVSPPGGINTAFNAIDIKALEAELLGVRRELEAMA
jgi:HK97 family phage portal protein